MINREMIVSSDDLFLVTGAAGFVGLEVIKSLLGSGFKNIRAFVRPSSNAIRLNYLESLFSGVRIQIIMGNLLSAEDCKKSMEDVSVVIHCAAGMEYKSYAEMYLNTVVTTRNLLNAAVAERRVKRFVNVSSFAVYSSTSLRMGGLVDENCAIERNHKQRYDPYSYAKVKQEEIVWEYYKKHRLPLVIVRPGAVYGPGGDAITSRVGVGTFGIFIHLGGSNRIPFTYIDNCAEAIVLASIKQGIEGEDFNIVDDDLPTSREFLRSYKAKVKSFRSLYIPYPVFYFLSFLWEKYSSWSKGQLPPVFNRRKSAANWKANVYSNMKIKKMLGWKQRVATKEGMERHFEYLRKARQMHA
jgi:nucleoside-diphosphate-sugar epimerase